MSRPGLRFLHVAGLRLGAPVSGAHHLPPDAAPLLGAAAAVAFENLVQAAVDRGVDFVLLHGDSFRDHDRSLAARTALLDGLEVLSEHRIPVVVAPGRDDPASAWERIADLPQCVWIVDPTGRGEPIEIDRDGDVIARIAIIPSQRRRWPSARIDDRDAALHVGVLCEAGDDGREASHHDRSVSRRKSVDSETDAADLIEGLFDRNSSHDSEGPADAELKLPWEYIAVPAGRGRRTAVSERRVLHSPGLSQGLSASETGLHGGSLVSWDAGRPATCELLPLSPVVQHQIELTVDASSTENRLLAAMQGALARFERHPVMQLLVCRWTIRGRGPLLRSLADREFQQLILESVVPESVGFAVGHSLRISPDGNWRSRPVRAADGDDPSLLGRNDARSRFTDHAAAILGDAVDDDVDLLPAALDAIDDAAVVRSLEACAAGVDRSRIADGAFRMLDEWLSDAGPERVLP